MSVTAHDAAISTALGVYWKRFWSALLVRALLRLNHVRLMNGNILLMGDEMLELRANSFNEGASISRIREKLAITNRLIDVIIKGEPSEPWPKPTAK